MLSLDKVKAATINRYHAPHMLPTMQAHPTDQYHVRHGKCSRKIEGLLNVPQTQGEMR
jgi:hypothetical protein